MRIFNFGFVSVDVIIPVAGVNSVAFDLSWIESVLLLKENSGAFVFRLLFAGINGAKLFTL